MELSPQSQAFTTIPEFQFTSLLPNPRSQQPSLKNSSVTYATVPLRPTASVHQSFAYRNRQRITGASLIAGLVATWLIKPGLGLNVATDVGFSVAGWSCLTAGAVLRLWASTYICGRKSVAVVRTGPYSLCRNPLYWGTFLMVGAFPLILTSPVLAVAMLPPIALYLFAVIPVEEAVMLGRHPREYRDYCRSVPRWLPNLARYDHGPAMDGTAEGFRCEYTRMIWWVAFAVIAQWLTPLC